MARPGWYWDDSYNPVSGCWVKISPGCENCYGADDAGGLQSATGIELYQGITERDAQGRWAYNSRVKALPPGHPDWTWPLRCRGVPNPILGPNRPAIIFVCIECDLFWVKRPSAIIQQVIDVMDMSNHIGLFLNKIVKRYREFFAT